MDYQIELDTIINDDTIILRGFEDWIGKKVHISVVLDSSNDIMSDEVISNNKSLNDLRGIFSKYANPDLRKLENQALEDAIAEKYKINENS